MTKSDIKRYGLVIALEAEFKGMLSKNYERVQRNESMAYPEEEFFRIADEIRVIVSAHDDEILLKY